MIRSTRAQILLRGVLVAVFALALHPFDACAQSDEIVELRGGSFVRGTIVERIEGSHVVVQTHSGELRRFELGEVVYAGPVERRTRRSDGSAASALGSPIAPTASNEDSRPLEGSPRLDAAPPTASSVQPRPRGQIELRVRSRDRRRGLVLHVLEASSTGSVNLGNGFGMGASLTVDSFRPLCVSPCTVDLSRGAYVFAVSRGEQTGTQRAPGFHQLSHDARLEVEYLDRGVERAMGVLTLIAGLAIGGALVLLPVFEGWGDLVPPIVAAGAVTGLSIVIGLPLMLFNDGARVRVGGSR